MARTSHKQNGGTTGQWSGASGPAPTNDVGNFGPSTAATVAASTSADEADADALVSEPSAGDAPVPGEGGGSRWTVEVGDDVGPDDEVGNPEGAEVGEGYVEATPAELAEPFEESSAVADLMEIEGFEPRSGREAAEVDEEAAIDEVGTALPGGGGGQSEELAVLGSLVPTLAADPTVGRALLEALSPRTRARLLELGAPPRRAEASANGAPTRGRRFARGVVLPLIGRLLRSADDEPTTAFAEADDDSPVEAFVEEAIVEEARAVLELIIERDDRVQIPNPAAIPWRQICALWITFQNGRRYRGTGFLIGPRTVVTAGHCVHLASEGGWAREIEVIPGASGTSRPYGSETSRTFRSVAGWIRDQRKESDYGCIVLPPNPFNGQGLGYLGFAALDPDELRATPVVLAGYPGDKPPGELWGMARRLKTITEQTLVYDIDTMGGQSGAPVYLTHNGQRRVCGIHNYGDLGGNSATRITGPVYQRLIAWKRFS